MILSTLQMKQDTSPSIRTTRATGKNKPFGIHPVASNSINGLKKHIVQVIEAQMKPKSEEGSGGFAGGSGCTGSFQ